MEDLNIGIIGLGYVGLPLAVSFSDHFQTKGYDINENRIKEISSGFDSTAEIPQKRLASAIKGGNLTVSANSNILKDCNFYIITVPTPIDESNTPILSPLIEASKLVGQLLSKNNIVVYESTVYPGLTEEICLPIIESESKMKVNIDFSIGYSPERINPGDKVHTLEKITKIVSASNETALKIITEVYGAIITAGIFKANSIKVAEAAKVIENTQRDINIAFVNELSIIFEKLGIDTLEVLEAARTKWNFLDFRPGLVGGHCIGVDPYYLARKSIEMGYIPEIILAGRRINNNIGKEIASRLIKEMINRDIKIKKSKCLILGFTFKENCPDIRNTRVIDIYDELKGYDFEVDVYDPLAERQEVYKTYSLDLLEKIPQSFENYSALIIAVAHKEFSQIKIPKNKQYIIFDIKGILDKEESDLRL